MEVMEGVIKFAFPKDYNLFSSKEKIQVEPYCLCYQYDIVDGYGPYGFVTKRAEKILDSISEKYVFWDASLRRTSQKMVFSKSCIGIPVEIFDELFSDYTAFSLWEKKRATLLRFKKNKQIISPPIPLLLDLLDDKKGTINVIAINQLLLRGYAPILCCFFAPQAGNTIVSFSPQIMTSIEDMVKIYGITYREFDKIGDLLPW